MSVFKKSKPNWDKPFPEKILKRIEKIPTADLPMWAEQALFELGRCLSSYEKARDAAHLTDALAGVEAAHAIVNEMHRRAML